MHSREPMPIACTLDPRSMNRRFGEIQHLTQEHLRSHRVEGRTLRLTYDLKAVSEVERIVDLERVCCAFLDFDIRASAETVELFITAPEAAGSDAQWLFAQFLPATTARGDALATRASACVCCRG
jgi:hypothetical protein